MLCAGTNGALWREMWNDWFYSDVIEYGLLRLAKREEMLDELSELEHPLDKLNYLLMKQM
ncbi:MAG: hypothetical protein EPO24_04120 [Bacteroidetes bacterium]|nr:MAG: hypothetical protein EPO24_04120 [Bacteroidota bacterium]